MYLSYLKQMLEPVGIYDLESGAGAIELEVLAEQLDEIFSDMETLASEAVPVTASSFGLSNYEDLLAYRPAYLNTEDRRRALISLLRIHNGCFTQELLQSSISGCGIAAVISESGTAQTVVVGFPQNRGIPDNFELLKERIEQIVPCHLAVEYSFVYTTWQELTALLVDWAGAESRCASWHDIEILEG